MIQQLCHLWLIVSKTVMRESASGCSEPPPTQSNTGSVLVQQIRHWPAHLLSTLSAGRLRTVTHHDDRFPPYVNTTCDFYQNGRSDGIIREHKIHSQTCPCDCWSIYFAYLTQCLVFGWKISLRVVEDWWQVIVMYWVSRFRMFCSIKFQAGFGFFPNVIY